MPQVREDMVEALKAVGPLIAQDNLREIKRFVNSTLIANSIALEAGVDISAPAQVVLMAIRFRWPEFAEQVNEQPGVLVRTRDYIRHAPGLAKEAADAVRAIVQKHVGLEEFLRTTVAGHFLDLNAGQLGQLLFYTRVVEAVEDRAAEFALAGDLLSRIRQAAKDKVTQKPRFLRFTERARTVFAHAQEEGRRINNGVISADHLLLGLLREPECMAFRILVKLNVDTSTLDKEVRALVGTGQVPAGVEVTLSPAGMEAIALAIASARVMERDYVGTEHILMGLLATSGAVSADVLASYGVTLDTVADKARSLSTSQLRKED